jgi:NADH-quinone oxidoreductase subunit A
MYFELANILVFLLIGILFVLGTLIIGWVLRPHRPYKEKLSTYECGEVPIGSSWIQFNIRFYIIALAFLIFDVEVAILFPWVTVFKKFGMLALVEMFIFIGILVVAFAYLWAKGDFEWLKAMGKPVPERKDEPSSDLSDT